MSQTKNVPCTNCQGSGSEPCAVCLPPVWRGRRNWGCRSHEHDQEPGRQDCTTCGGTGLTFPDPKRRDFVGTGVWVQFGPEPGFKNRWVAYNGVQSYAFDSRDEAVEWARHSRRRT